MTEPVPSSLTPFAWVTKRDGRLVPFEADKISRALFAAAESLGRPDAFLARELTDGILHFLAAEAPAAPPTTAQVADLVAKVVRELGHPALARAFSEGRARKAGASAKDQSPPKHREQQSPAGAASPLAPVGPPLRQLGQWVEGGLPPAALAWRVADRCLHAYALREVFTRDLAAAHADGLLTLTGLESPLELAGCVLPTPLSAERGMVAAVEEARSLAGGFVALDNPQYELARLGQGEQEAAAFVDALRTGLRLTRLRAVVNLNCALPPPASDDRAVGPLFPGRQPGPAAEPGAELTDGLLEQCLAGDAANGLLRVDWHLGPGDFAPAARGRLAALIRRALEGARLAFVFDRPRRPVALAEGLSRQHPAALLVVGLHLPWLVGQLQPRPEPALFLRKLGSLVRLALSAATQKRDFLRRHSQARPMLARGFRLERARLVVVPVGLEAIARALTARGLCAGGASLEFGRQVVGRLREVLRQDGRAYLLEAGPDSPPPGSHFGPGEGEAAGPVPPEQAAGLTPWDGMASSESQLRACGPLHAAAEAGTAMVLLAGEQLPAAEAVLSWLRQAWQQTDVVRVRIVPGRPSQRQLTVSWDEAG